MNSGHSSTRACIFISSSYSHPGWIANTLLLPIDITLAQTCLPSTPLTEKLFYAKPLSQLNTQLNMQAHISHSCHGNMQMHKHRVPRRLCPFSESNSFIGSAQLSLLCFMGQNSS